MDWERTIGLNPDGSAASLDRRRLIQIIALKLSALGFQVPDSIGDKYLLDLGRDLFARYREQSRLLSQHLNPADQRIQDFLNGLVAHVKHPTPVRLPREALIVDRFGLARELSLPIDQDSWNNEVISSYRLDNGVLHNPVNDRRTTQGVFHVADYGLPVPADKVAVPLGVYLELLRHALRPPPELARLPFTANWDEPVETMVSLLLRPLVCPAVPGRSREKRLEVRFFAPGGLVANLDFVEGIFGNAGDPFLPENDAGLDVDHWTGHSGCVILAPHLTRLRKKDLGLPRMSEASEAQRASGMCWTEESELYNEGKPFKITARSSEGVMVTILADNYFGYCKKEVKTQISLSANLFGLAEEEHAGGALAFSTFSLGDTFIADAHLMNGDHRFSDVVELLGDSIDVHESGYASDRRFPSVHYLPENIEIDVKKQSVTWLSAGQEQRLRILPGRVYIHPSGYKVRMEKHPAAPSWRLVGTVPEGTFCHKPCTVSGGGKSEISKSLVDAVLFGPIYVNDFEEDMKLVEEILRRNFRHSYLPGTRADQAPRPLLSPKRSLGSVIKALTPNEREFSAEYNEWLGSIPNHVRALVFVIKRFYRQQWGEKWQNHFSVDIINGHSGHELKYDGRRLVGTYLRIGLLPNGAWRTFKLRQDFVAADKVQMEDDITASVVVSAENLFGLPKEYAGHPSLKLSENCEWRLFQRPDDAIHPGFDKQAELDISSPGLFASNFQPLQPAEIKEIAEDAALHSAFTKPMRRHIDRAKRRADGFSVCSAKPRMVGGKPTKNPRYLQTRPDVVHGRDKYVAKRAARLYRRIPVEKPVVFPVISVLSGRRNNPPQESVRPLCVYNPIHYQELPELFMDYVCSLTGKSPSTTGAGSEGALTKGPFNAIAPTADLNNAIVSMILCGYAGFSTAAGWIGPKYRVDHDISLLIPEVWCRLYPEERDPARLITNGQLEKLEDYEYEGEKILASRLGYRITSNFVHTYFGRVFDSPMAVFTEEILRPELQDPAVFADGVRNITEAQQRVAENYFKDGSIDGACPPLRALLHIMAYGDYQGKGIEHPEIRGMFTRETLLRSDWYRERLEVKRERDVALWQRHCAYLERFLAMSSHQDEAARLKIRERLEQARAMLQEASSSEYVKTLRGTIGADPIRVDASQRLAMSAE